MIDDDAGPWAIRNVDVSVAHPARRYDYWLGGKDNFAADRESGDAVEAMFPTIRAAAVENRRFLGRAVRFLADECGIDQFLDIGTGIPGVDNTHEVAQAIDPGVRVVYVDNDPIVLTHARALLTSDSAAGRTSYIDADLRDPDRILGDPAVAQTFDLGRPVALLLLAVLHFVPDDDRPHDAVARLVDALPDGSYLAMSHVTHDFLPPEQHAPLDAAGRTQAGFQARSLEEFTRFLDGHEVVDPGIVPVSDWRPDGDPDGRPRAADIAQYGAVARVRRGTVPPADRAAGSGRG